MTHAEYHEAVMRTAPPCSPGYENLINAMMGLCGESGEAIDIVKKFLFQGHELDRERLTLELGDIAWYLDFAAHLIGLTMEDVLCRNVQKLKERYPEGFCPENSIHRKENRHE